MKPKQETLQAYPENLKCPIFTASKSLQVSLFAPGAL